MENRGGKSLASRSYRVRPLSFAVTSSHTHFLSRSTHVHLNQPGRTAWEGFRTGTLAAISGGITTLIDMPLNSIPPTTTLSGLATKKASAKEVGVSCDLGFWGGIVPGNEEELRGLWDGGVKGFKCFLIESGVEVSAHFRNKTEFGLLGVSMC